MMRVIFGNTPTVSIIILLTSLPPLLMITQLFGLPLGLSNQCGVKTGTLSVPLCTLTSDKDVTGNKWVTHDEDHSDVYRTGNHSHVESKLQSGERCGGK
jgi:hypothetical protein